jgi:endonuclease-3 related protein
VIDAYTRRIFSRIGLIVGSEPYDDIRLLFEGALPRDSRLYQEYHALIVEHAKRHCRSREPLCQGCAIAQRCCFDKDAE